MSVLQTWRREYCQQFNDIPGEIGLNRFLPVMRFVSEVTVPLRRRYITNTVISLLQNYPAELFTEAFSFEQEQLQVIR